MDDASQALPTEFVNLELTLRPLLILNKFFIIQLELLLYAHFSLLLCGVNSNLVISSIVSQHQ